MSHIKQQVVDIKNQLVKLMTNENEDRLILDILTSLEKMVMTSDLINSTGLGKTISKIREKYSSNNEIYNKTHGLLLSWKKIVLAEKSASEIAASTSEGPSSHTSTEKDQKLLRKQQQASSIAEFKKESVSTTPLKDSDIKNRNKSRQSLLSFDRLSGYRPLFNTFKAFNISECEAETFALDIEEAMHKEFSAPTSAKAYLQKAKTLVFNLKSNESLRAMVLKKEIEPSKLVSLNAKELASDLVNEARNKAAHEVADEHRLDWYDAHRSEIQKKLGIDPNLTWDFDDNNDSHSEPDIDPPDI